MAHTYEDSQGFLALGTSIGGRHTMLDALIREKVDMRLYPHLHEFLDTDRCNVPEALQGEVMRLAKGIKDKNARNILLALAHAAAKAKDFLQLVR